MGLKPAVFDYHYNLWVNLKKSILDLFAWFRAMHVLSG